MSTIKYYHRRLQNAPVNMHETYLLLKIVLSENMLMIISCITTEKYLYSNTHSVFYFSFASQFFPEKRNRLEIFNFLICVSKN